MSRQIITAKSLGKMGASAADQKEADKYTDMVLKLIPGEFVSVYLGAFTLIESYTAKEDNSGLQWVIFSLAFVVLFIYLKKTGVSSNSQLALTLLAFVLWVLTLGGPLAGYTIAGYPPEFLGSLVLPFYTLLVPVLYHKVE
jgi:hypothetical protein